MVFRVALIGKQGFNQTCKEQPLASFEAGQAPPVPYRAGVRIGTSSWDVAVRPPCLITVHPFNEQTAQQSSVLMTS